jgi:hypothetical protein
MADRGDPGRAVNLEADEAGRGLRGLAGVDAHANAQLLTGGPLVARQGQLHLECCCHTGAGRGEDRKEGVALGPLLDAVVGQEAGADEPVVVFEDLGVEVVAEAAQERRRSLDIGEQERQRLDVESVGDERRGASAGSVHLLSAREGTIGSHPTVSGCRYEANANRLPHRIPTGLDGRTRRSRRLGVPRSVTT